MARDVDEDLPATIAELRAENEKLKLDIAKLGEEIVKSARIEREACARAAESQFIPGYMRCTEQGAKAVDWNDAGKEIARVIRARSKP